MSILACTYFDGRLSTPHPSSLILDGRSVRVVGRDVAVSVDARRVRVSQRIADTPRWFYLPEGGACRVDDNDAVDRVARESPLNRRLHRWESRPALAALALIAVIALVGTLVKFGVPLAADPVARRIPLEAEKRIGVNVLAELDRQWMAPSRLSPVRMRQLRGKFATLLAADGGAAGVVLEFRDSPRAGPNAFALPGGIIVVTDQLVQLARHDNETAGVLAHELGHVRQRHLMRGLLEGSAVALIFAAITGDIASTSTLVASAPLALMHSKFSRDNESEADRFAIELMQRAKIDTGYFALMLGRLRDRSDGRLPPFLASHPSTVEREALARASGSDPARLEPETRQRSVDAKAAGANPAAAASAEHQPRRVIVDPALIRDPRQQRIVRLVLAGDIGALESEVGALQAAFERDAGASEELIRAFHAFSKLPESAAPTLDAWNARSPNSHVAALARTRFNFDLAFDARGTATAAATPKENFARMEVLFGIARGDARRALAFSPRPILSHRYLMLMANADGDAAEVRAQYAAAEKLAPASVETRLAYMRTLQPRWGGSVKSMREYVVASRPALTTRDADRLAAALESHLAEELGDGDKYTLALKRVDAALELYEDAETRCRRARILQHLDRDAEAFADVRRALRKEPEVRECLREATRVSVATADDAAALDMLNMVVAYGMAEAETYAQRGWRYQKADRAAEAFSDYRKAATLGHTWAQVRTAEFLDHGRGVARDSDKAMEWLDKAAQAGDKEAIRIKSQVARNAPPRR